MGIYDEMSADEWVSLASPFLAPDDPHQRCVAVQRETGGQYCACPTGPCTADCCAPHDDWVI